MDDGDIAALLGHVLHRDIEPPTLRIGRPAGGGWSNDTVIVQVDAATKVVVRRTPANARASMFPHYDLGREHACITTLAAAGVPVPPVLGDDLACAITERPAFVMGFVDGRIAADDRPSFAEAGWLHDATPAEQREFHESLIASLASINAVRPDDHVVVTLQRPGPSAVAGLLDDLASIWDFDRGDHWPATLDGLFGVLAREIPSATNDGMLWGDGRPANVITHRHTFSPAALVDFELAAWGPAELDITWLAEMNRMRTTGSGVAPLPGFLSDEDALASYEHCAGRPLDRNLLEWATRFNALKVAVLMHRHLRVMVHEDRLPADHRVLVDNVATRRCTDLA